ncbi:MAG TPA: hypothetical protein VK914_10070 [bacterium]|jgi:hypothetical protein|nr:hypothetical protein [bacterium]
MNKRILLAGLTALCLAGAGLVHADDMGAMDMKGAPAKTVTLVGEVLDMDCFMNEGAHGAKHRDCAVMCLNNGSPVGLLTDDGKAYFLTANESKGKMKFYDRVRDMGGQRVKITGVMQDRAGTHCLRIDDAEKQ